MCGEILWDYPNLQFPIKLSPVTAFTIHWRFCNAIRPFVFSGWPARVLLSLPRLIYLLTQFLYQYGLMDSHFTQLVITHCHTYFDNQLLPIWPVGAHQADPLTLDYLTIVPFFLTQGLVHVLHCQGHPHWLCIWLHTAGLWELRGSCRAERREVTPQIRVKSNSEVSEDNALHASQSALGRAKLRDDSQTDQEHLPRKATRRRPFPVPFSAELLLTFHLLIKTASGSIFHAIA